MMTLFEIIERVKDNRGVPNRDLRLALLALDHLSTFDRNDLERVIDYPHAAKMWCEENFRRWKTALNSEPLKWLGPDNLPESEEYQRRRRVALSILRKVEGYAP